MQIVTNKISFVMDVWKHPSVKNEGKCWPKDNQKEVESLKDKELHLTIAIVDKVISHESRD